MSACAGSPKASKTPRPGESHTYGVAPSNVPGPHRPWVVHAFSELVVELVWPPRPSTATAGNVDRMPNAPEPRLDPPNPSIWPPLEFRRHLASETWGLLDRRHWHWVHAASGPLVWFGHKGEAWDDRVAAHTTSTVPTSADNTPWDRVRIHLCRPPRTSSRTPGMIGLVVPCRPRTPPSCVWFGQAGRWVPPCRWPGTARLHRRMSLAQTPPGSPNKADTRRGSLVGAAAGVSLASQGP